MARSSGRTAPGAITRPRAGFRTRVRAVRADGTPVYRYEGSPGAPPVSVIRYDEGHVDSSQPVDQRHVHDFYMLAYVESGGGDLRLDREVQPLRTGEVILVPPGQVIGVGAANPPRGRAWAVAFMPDAVPALVGTPAVALASHPLLAPFARVGAPRTVTVPPDRRPAWLGWLGELEAETADPSRVGSREAATAVLTRLLVDLARVAGAGGASPGGTADPLVARVLALVERRFAEPVSTASLARELGYTAGHLTTVMRERTGRTVLDWLTERRMAEVRRLLAETDLSLAAIATRTGYRDAAYLARRFRAWHGTTPLKWRRGSRT